MDGKETYSFRVGRNLFALKQTGSCHSLHVKVAISGDLHGNRIRVSKIWLFSSRALIEFLLMVGEFHRNFVG